MGTCKLFNDPCLLLSSVKNNRYLYFIFALILMGYIAELALYSFGPDGLNLFGTYPFFNIDRVNHFIDLQVVTLNGHDCRLPLESIYEEGCYFNPTNIPKLFIYAARLLRIGADSTKAAGFILGSSSIGLILFTYQHSLPRLQAVFAAALVVGCFPYRLAMERGNIDLLVLILLLTSALFLSFSNSKYRPYSLLCICGSSICASIAVSGKAYPALVSPAIILTILFADNFHHKEKTYLLSLITALLIGSVAVLLPDISHMTSSSYREIAGGLGYGLLTSPDKDLSTVFIIASKLAIIGIITSSAVFDKSDFFGSRTSAKDLLSLLTSSSPKQRFIPITFLFGSSILLGTYFVFINGIYRLSVSLALITIWIVHSLCAEKSKGQQRRPNGTALFTLSLLLIAYSGYRPYVSDSDLQHLTQIFIEFFLYPLTMGWLISVLYTLTLLITSKTKDSSLIREIN